MGESLETALLLLLVGMITVIFVLALIIASGLLLIRIVNKYYPLVKTPGIASSSVGALDPRVIAAAAATVDWLTEGEGKVEEFRKKE